MAIPPDRVTTAMDFAGYRIVPYRGVVPGIVVRSRSVVGSLQSDDAARGRGRRQRHRRHALRRKRDRPGVTEVLANGTAVVIEPAGR